ncbi:MAG: GGDEF domain-containing protein [Lachnospiraceae bacterium]|nr:GGDEF domain-containing protein [Lachnospiraceae bacterium]
MGENQKRVPIRRRVLKTVLLTTLVAMLAASLTSLICMIGIKNKSEHALTEQLERNLMSLVRQKTVAADAKLEHYEGYILFLTDYIENMYKGREILISIGHLFDPPLTTIPKGEYAMTRGFTSDKITVGSVKDDILFFSNIEQVYEPIARENDGLISTVYLGTKSGLLASYDKWSYLSAVEPGEEVYYDYTQSSWYQQGLKENGVFYTGLYTDSQGRGLTITVASPFKDTDGVFQGVDCADFDITGLYDDMISIDMGEGAFSFAIDAEGAIISPDSDESASRKKYTGLTNEELKMMSSGEEGILQKDKAFYVYAPIERVGWTLCACVPREIVLGSVRDVEQSIIIAILIFIAITALILIIVLLASYKVAGSITYPMELLGRDMETIADGDIDYRASVYRNDEIGDITLGLNAMLDRLESTLTELDDTKLHAEEMSALANKDALTGIRNKTAYDKEVQKTEWDLLQGNTEFGFAMVDLNSLKKINDTFGHDKGNIAIKKLCHLICETFVHSPVFRIGGDEFAVILRGNDYHNIDRLISEFNKNIDTYATDDSLEPWEKVSAAIGYALYDKKIDSSVDNVFKRADQAMYEHKKQMKALCE